MLLRHWQSKRPGYPRKRGVISTPPRVELLMMMIIEATRGYYSVSIHVSRTMTLVKSLNVAWELQQVE